MTRGSATRNFGDGRSQLTLALYFANQQKNGAPFGAPLSRPSYRTYQTAFKSILVRRIDYNVSVTRYVVARRNLDRRGAGARRCDRHRVICSRRICRREAGTNTSINLTGYLYNAPLGQWNTREIRAGARSARIIGCRERKGCGHTSCRLLTGHVNDSGDTGTEREVRDIMGGGGRGCSSRPSTRARRQRGIESCQS